MRRHRIITGMLVTALCGVVIALPSSASPTGAIPGTSTQGVADTGADAGPEGGFQGEGGGLDDADFRTGRVAPTAAQLGAVESLGATARWNDFGTPSVLFRTGEHLSGPSEGGAKDIARSWLVANRAAFGLSADALSEDGLELVRDSPLYDAPDLKRVRNGALPLNINVAHVVLFGQRAGSASFGGADGQVSVGVDRRGQVTYVSSTLAKNTSVTNTRTIDAVAAYRIAADAVGFGLASDDFRRSTKQLVPGFTSYVREGVGDLQYVRESALPTPTGGVRLVWETVVLHASPAAGEPIAFVQFVDAQTGQVLLRTNNVDYLESPESRASLPVPSQVPQSATFSGTTSTVPATGFCAPSTP